MTIGESMRAAREKAGLSRNKLAQKSGVAVSCISVYERDQFEPKISKVEILADALGISIDEYIGHEVRTNVK